MADLSSKYGAWSLHGLNHPQPYRIPLSSSAEPFRTGDVTYLCIFGQPIIILGSYETAHEFLHKRSVNYSDRLQPIMAEA